MPSVHIDELEMKWLLSLRKEVTSTVRGVESIASVMKRIHEKLKGVDI